MIRVFFDTEFTDLIVDHQLIRIGLIDETGERTFYAELSDTYRLADVGDFAREAVLPQLEGGAALMTMDDLRERLKVWLEAFDWPVRLATDSLSWDWPWIQEIFTDYNVNYDSPHARDSWPFNLDGKPLILTQDQAFNQAVERAFAEGLRRHHALDDAKANRLAWIAIAGDTD
ncbi:hypothetical protein [Sulfuricella sp.]|uniref:hypothetical protein n=1 Tax=Sulfuricella sp. TaxID=2099377 RepID=UPI002C0A586F|nr:hypothetical protein [Sulfuricella sp.]HUX62224.1 hypothetical protein [Sulfuricella sp.]